MPYIKQTWVDNDPTKPLSAARMNVLETQAEQTLADIANRALGTGNSFVMSDSSGTLPQVISSNLDSRYGSYAVRDQNLAMQNFPGGFTLGSDDFSSVNQTGLSASGSSLGATVSGTDGTALFPVWSTQKNFRTSLRVLVSKNTTGSRSMSGWYTLAPGATPSATNFAFGVGYLQGTGLAIIRENVGSSIVLIPDANLSDGTYVDVVMWADTSLSTTSGSSTGIAYAQAYSVGSGALLASTSTSFSLTNFPVNNNLVRTNVAGSPIQNLVITQGSIGGNMAGISRGEVPYQPSEAAYLWLPKKSNGKLVIALHGHGSSPNDTGTSSNFFATWTLLANQGFTVAVPRVGGDLWGNPAAQAYIQQLYSQLMIDYNLDPRVHLWGNSMGGGAALTAIFRKTVPVKSAYLAEPASNLEWVAGTGSYPTLNAAYASTAERDSYDPQKQPASAFAGVPMLFTASAGDTAILKTQNTDLMRSKLGTTVPNYLLTVSGSHNDPSHFRAMDTLNFFRANA